MNPNRRPLEFANVDAIMPDVERLLAGNRTVGQWSLGQICEHLASVTRYFLAMPADTVHDPALRITDEQKREVFGSKQIPEGNSMPSEVQPPTPITDAEGADQLRSALSDYQASPTGPVASHRRLGPLSRPEWDQLVCIHSAHHLSFALPEAA